MVDGPGEVDLDLDSDAEEDNAGLKGPGLTDTPLACWVLRPGAGVVGLTAYINDWGG